MKEEKETRGTLQYGNYSTVCVCILNTSHNVKMYVRAQMHKHPGVLNRFFFSICSSLEINSNLKE